MEVIEGNVQKLRLGTEVSSNGNLVATRHFASLQLQRRPVRLECAKPIMLEEGDLLAVAGIQGADGVLTGYAYRNRANGVTSVVPGLANYLLSVPFLAISAGATLIGLTMLATARGGEASFAAAFTLAFGFFGMRIWRQIWRERRAAAALN